MFQLAIGMGVQVGLTCVGCPGEGLTCPSAVEAEMLSSPSCGLGSSRGSKRLCTGSAEGSMPVVLCGCKVWSGVNLRAVELLAFSWASRSALSCIFCEATLSLLPASIARSSCEASSLHRFSTNSCSASCAPSQSCMRSCHCLSRFSESTWSTSAMAWRSIQLLSSFPWAHPG